MKPGRIDLHVHTTASDGSLSPAEMVREAAERGISLLGITDHDTTEGIAAAQAAAREMGITLVPGVELSADSEAQDIHLLAYFINPEDPDLQSLLTALRETRNARNERILERLRSLGAPVCPERVAQIAGSGSVGRPHIAEALVEAGHVTSRNEAFSRYLARGKPAFVTRARFTPAEACALIKRAGGIAVLGHAAKIGSRAAIEEVLAAGLDGIEVYHTDHTAKDVDMLLALAREKSLLATGGTDSHGPHSDRPLALGSVTVPAWVGEEVLRRAPEWWRRLNRR